MPKTSYYTIAANSGSYTDIPSTIPSRKMWIRECRKSDGSALVYQGLRAKFYNDRTGVPYATVEYPDTAASDITIEHPAMAGNAYSPVIGYPAVNDVANGVYSALTSYSLGDTVTDAAGKAWRSLAGTNLGNTPKSSPTKWEPIFNYRAADIPVKLLSDTATATYVECIEYE